MRAAVLGLALAAHGCAALPGAPPRLAECPGPLLDAAEIPGGDFRLHERLRVRGGAVEWSGELVAERRGARLVLVGIDAFGVRAFGVEQHGREISVDAPLGRALPLPPRNALRDLHAARFLAPDAGGRVEIARPGCGYTATFVRVERRALP